MVLIYSSAVESVRRPYFEAFWFTHHLFIAWFILLIIHGSMSTLEPSTFWAWLVGTFRTTQSLRISEEDADTWLHDCSRTPARVRD